MTVYFNDKPSAYARIEMIDLDVKPHWYKFRLLFLGFPPQEVTWILREEYVEGTPFTMKDIPMRIVPLGRPGEGGLTHQEEKMKKSGAGQVLSFDTFRKKKSGGDTGEGNRNG